MTPDRIPAPAWVKVALERRRAEARGEGDDDEDVVLVPPKERFTMTFVVREVKRGTIIDADDEPPPPRARRTGRVRRER